MIRPARLALLLVLATFATAIAFQSRGDAQTAPETGRFAFADTTLLRDTLNLHFDGLFPLADSLGVAPDSMRAWSIRYRLPLGRIVFLADSLRMPVDSVGPVMKREEYNPLATANRTTHRNTFVYTSGYIPQQTYSTWNNTIDWNVVQGPKYLHNSTYVNTLDQPDDHRSDNASTTDVGWKPNANTALGANAQLKRYRSVSQTEDFNQFQLSASNKARWLPGLTNEIHLLAGYLGDVNAGTIKRGVSGSFNFKSRYEAGRWLVNDLSGYSSGNFARTALELSPEFARTKDTSNLLDGTLGMYQNAPVALNVNYGIHRSVVSRLQVPQDSASIATYVLYGPQVVPVRNIDDHLNATVKMRQGNDRYLNITENLGRTGRADAGNIAVFNNGTSSNFDLSGHYLLWKTSIEANFNDDFSRTQFPDAYTNASSGASGGYASQSATHHVDALITRNFLKRLNVKLSGIVNLLSARYRSIGATHVVPADLDSYRQSYRIDGSYTFSQAFATGLGLEVVRTVDVNISADETRTYRAEWHWTYQLLPGLTVTQNNQLNSIYGISTERATLTHRTLTTLDAILTPRVSLELTHAIGRNTTGDYEMIDGIPYLSKSGDTRTYTLSSHVSYQPLSQVTFSVDSNYLAGNSLSLAGGASLNVPLGGNSNLTGNVNRNYLDRVVGTGRSQSDYWSGDLELKWQP